MLIVICCTQRFITVLRGICHHTQSSATLIKCKPLHTVSFKNVYLLPSHLCVIFPSGLLTRILYVCSYLPYVCYILPS